MALSICEETHFCALNTRGQRRKSNHANTHTYTHTHTHTLSLSLCSTLCRQPAGRSIFWDAQWGESLRDVWLWASNLKWMTWRSVIFNSAVYLLVCVSEGTRAFLTTVLDVERELEGLRELAAGAGGSHLQNHRELSESRQTDDTHTL